MSISNIISPNGSNHFLNCNKISINETDGAFQRDDAGTGVAIQSGINNYDFGGITPVISVNGSPYSPALPADITCTTLTASTSVTSAGSLNGFDIHATTIDASLSANVASLGVSGVTVSNTLETAGLASLGSLFVGGASTLASLTASSVTTPGAVSAGSLSVSGSSSVVNVVSTGVFSSSGQPCCIQTASPGALVQAIGNGAETLLDATWTTGTPSSFIQGSLVFGSGIMTVPSSGIYLVSASIGWEGSAVGERFMYLKINDDNLTRVTDQNVASAALNATNQITSILQLTALDNLRLTALQTSGGVLNIDSSNCRVQFSAYRLF